MGINKIHGSKKQEIAEAVSVTSSSSGFTKNINAALTPTIGQIEQLYQRAKMMQTLVEKAAANPGRTGCATVALGFGLSQLFSGHLMSGGALAALAASELKNVFWANENRDLQRLFHNVQADVGMIDTLQEANSKSCTIVQTHLGEIQKEVGLLEKQLEKIVAIHEEGMSQVAEKKEEAIRLTQEAETVYKEALSLFTNTKSSIESAQKHYDNCKKLVEEIQDLTTSKNAKNPSQDQVGLLVNAARDASTACSRGKSSLNSSMEYFSSALGKLHEAAELKNNALRATEEAMQIAEKSIALAKAHAAHESNCSKKVEAAQKEMKKIEKRNTQITSVMSELKTDIIAVRKEAEARWSISEIFLSVGMASCLTPPATAMGLMGMMAASVSLGYAYRNRSQLATAVSYVYRTAMKIQDVAPEPMKSNELVRAQFNRTSSGLWGHYVQGRPSHTVGTMMVDLNGEIITLPFNLNDPKDPIDRLALLNLLETMSKKFSDQTLSAELCLQIVGRLKSCAMWPGNAREIKLLGNSQAISIALSLLEEQCEEAKASLASASIAPVSEAKELLLA